VRALRWVLEPRWASPTRTPWDGTDTPSPLPPASLGSVGCFWLVAGVLVVGVVLVAVVAGVVGMLW
jgi:hypothetical protein